ncbi:hypothetical protein IVA80_10940 [Bradyrhizobium sp. 139]|uniref:hypothetical protein n=1 Tax=Bradyrhizobium sp. 139 TaxID=2782616 RepID=UPI001FF87C44|nr:hypothetical protein [Bradyrhizobium sp. 139]MCK1741366.1 hypothetical protein [Bradyrhizobium sp. 139]
MALGEWKITLRVDFDDKKKPELMTRLAMQLAKELLGSATLIADKRKPQVAVEHGDMFAGNKEVEMVDDEEVLDEV